MGDIHTVTCIWKGGQEDLERFGRELSGIKRQGRDIHGSTRGQMVRKDACLEKSIFRELMKTKVRQIG